MRRSGLAWATALTRIRLGEVRIRHRFQKGSRALQWDCRRSCKPPASSEAQRPESCQPRSRAWFVLGRFRLCASGRQSVTPRQCNPGGTTDVFLAPSRPDLLVARLQATTPSHLCISLEGRSCS